MFDLATLVAVAQIKIGSFGLSTDAARQSRIQWSFDTHLSLWVSKRQLTTGPRIKPPSGVRESPFLLTPTLIIDNYGADMKGGTGSTVLSTFALSIWGGNHHYTNG